MASNNTSQRDVGNTTTSNRDTGNDQSTTLTSNRTTNTTTSDSHNLSATLTSNRDSGNTDSHANSNNNSSTNSLDLTVTVSNQDLNSTVTGAPVSFKKGGTLTTGAISYGGSAFANFAGIQTVSLNSGVGSSVQAATSLAANANVSFGH